MKHQFLSALWASSFMAVLSCGGAALAYQAPAQEVADVAVVHEIEQSHGDHALGHGQVLALLAVLSHAPKSYPVQQKVGGDVVIHADTPEEGASSALLAMATGSGSKVFVEPNVYPKAAFLLTWDANQRGDFAAANAYADRGLAMQPGNDRLTSEKAMALYLTGHVAEGLAVVQSWLDGDHVAGPEVRARMIRAKGWALIELHDLDAAQVAYDESLKLQPGHAGALHEIGCIKALRAGLGCQGTPRLMTADQAKDPAIVSSLDKK